MKYFLLIFLSINIAGSLSAQYIYLLKGDSVKFTNFNSDSTDLIIENHTQGIHGFLYNKGRGRTEFRKGLIRVSDSTYLIGVDTLKMFSIPYWALNASNIYNINTGKVGIHRSDPKTMLDMPGPVNIDDTTSFQMNNTPIFRVSDYRSGTYNTTCVGDGAAVDFSGGFINEQSLTAVGFATGELYPPGPDCTFLGVLAGGASNYNNLANAGYNSAIGVSAGQDIFGSRNTYMGTESGTFFNPLRCTGIGNYGGYGTGGIGQVHLGDSAGGLGSQTYNSVYIGGHYTITNLLGLYGTGITLIGVNSGILVHALDDATAIGYQVVPTLSNAMLFGDGSTNTWLFNSNATTASGKALVVGYNSTNGNGAYLTTGGAWTNASDKFKKEDFRQLDDDDMLDKINLLPVSRWNYKGSSDEHVGPVAQDFHRIFQLGTDDKTISTIDPSGVALTGIQALYHKWIRMNNRNISQRQLLEDQKCTMGRRQAEIKDLMTIAERQKTEIASQDADMRRMLQTLNELEKEIDTTPHR